MQELYLQLYPYTTTMPLPPEYRHIAPLMPAQSHSPSAESAPRALPQSNTTLPQDSTNALRRRTVPKIQAKRTWTCERCLAGTEGSMFSTKKALSEHVRDVHQQTCQLDYGPGCKLNVQRHADGLWYCPRVGCDVSLKGSPLQLKEHYTNFCKFRSRGTLAEMPADLLTGILPVTFEVKDDAEDDEIVFLGMSKRWPDDSSGEEEKAVERELLEGVYSDTEDGMDAVLARQQPANGSGEGSLMYPSSENAEGSRTQPHVPPVLAEGSARPKNRQPLNVQRPNNPKIHLPSPPVERDQNGTAFVHNNPPTPALRNPGHTFPALNKFLATLDMSLDPAYDLFVARGLASEYGLNQLAILLTSPDAESIYDALEPFSEELAHRIHYGAWIALVDGLVRRGECMRQ